MLVLVHLWVACVFVVSSPRFTSGPLHAIPTPSTALRWVVVVGRRMDAPIGTNGTHPSDLRSDVAGRWPFGSEVKMNCVPRTVGVCVWCVCVWCRARPPLRLQCYRTSSRPHSRVRETGSVNVPLQDTSRNLNLC